MSDREYLVVVIAGILNAVVTWTLLANLNSFLLEKGVSGLDVNKPHKPRLPEEGGIAMTFSLILSFSLYAFFLGYRWMFLIIVTTIMISAIGFIDHFRNTKPYPKFLYCAAAGGVYALYYLDGSGTTIAWGIVTYLLVATTYSVLVNSFNLLAGFNGLEAGLTVISSAALSIYFLASDRTPEASVAFFVAVSYAVFYRFNRYPARIFIGNSGTLVPASIFFGLAILSGEWVPVLFVMAPHLINALIRLSSTGVSSRSEFSPLIYRNGLLHLPPNSYLSLIRMYLMFGPKHEQQIVRYVLAVEFAFCLLMFVIL